MAADSIIGGTEVAEDLGETIMKTINDYMDDTLAETLEETEIGDTILVQGVGVDGETQGVLVPSNTATTGTLTNGDFVIDVDLPANVGLAFEGLNDVVTGADAAAWYAEEVEENIAAEDTTDAANALRSSLDKAINLVLNDEDTDTVVRVVSVLAEEEATGVDVTITGAGGEDTNEVVALNINKLGEGNTLIIENLDKAIIVGAGAVEVGDDTDAMVVGDSRDQSITGNVGADTLVGGGGNDTLTGGEGNDVFGINAGGNLTITDFSEGDTIAFQIAGFENAQDVLDDITTEIVGEDTVATFSDGSTITLVGVTPDELTVDMFTFIV